ncbi:unnamed protein product [Moneuplotes crassus]|uniref:Uncharacterized protein n=1 Tax=Euplotes crassus TaxID=5936 RepID=A0AAD1UAE8_EUPCR|nr:unnamed protein product [Moneuplotes crassus]
MEKEWRRGKCKGFRRFLCRNRGWRVEGGREGFESKSERYEGLEEEIWCL